jgi:hypothetical protein
VKALHTCSDFEFTFRNDFPKNISDCIIPFPTYLDTLYITRFHFSTHVCDHPFIARFFCNQLCMKDICGSLHQWMAGLSGIDREMWHQIVTDFPFNAKRIATELSNGKKAARPFVLLPSCYCLPLAPSLVRLEGGKTTCLCMI